MTAPAPADVVLHHLASDAGAPPADLPVVEPFPGFRARLLHGATSTIAWWTIDEGAALPAHEHPHEQAALLVSGRFELTVDGTPHVLEPGGAIVIPGGVRHSGRALAPCRMIDVFTPRREDLPGGAD